MKKLWVPFVVAYDWLRIEPQGALPKPRQGHVALSYGDDIYIVGGCLADLNCFNDVEQFDTETRQWRAFGLEGEPMDPRGGHSVAVLGSHAYMLFGASSDNSFDDVFRIDLKERRWLKGQTVRSSVSPGARTNHASCVGKHGKVYIFGGYDVNRGEYLSDVWVMDTVWTGIWQERDTFPIIWRKVDGNGAMPSGRESHTATFIDDRVYIVGGYSNGRTVSDVYVLDTTDASWRFVTPVAPFPQARQGHIGLRLGRSIVLAGGCDITHNTEVCYNDVWEFDVTSAQWTQKSSDMISWKPREGAAGAFLHTNLFIFGGQNAQQAFGDIIALHTDLRCIHGTPIQDKCRCNHGFGGYDCMVAEDCPLSCHGHGDCSGGQCTCESGFFGDTCAQEVPCPNKCSKQGLCLSDSSCACYPGYYGLDCSLGSARCPENCSGRGKCTQDAICGCNLGWTGTSCAIKQNCPLQCCGHGTCGVEECVCDTGWFGPACNLDWGVYQMLSSVAKHQSEQWFAEAKDKLAQAGHIHDLEMLWASGKKSEKLDAEIQKLTSEAHRAETQAAGSSIGTLSDLGVNIQTCQVLAPSIPVLSLIRGQDMEAKNVWPKFVASHRVNKKPTTNDFGVPEINPKGSVGIVESQCEDNCNSRGFCSQRTCYCQPGFYGKTCAEKKQAEEGTLGVAIVAIVTSTSLMISVICTISSLQYSSRQKRKAEREMGYLV